MIVPAAIACLAAAAAAGIVWFGWELIGRIFAHKKAPKA
jgi:hypothetical protein